VENSLFESRVSLSIVLHQIWHLPRKYIKVDGAIITRARRSLKTRSPLAMKPTGQLCSRVGFQCTELCRLASAPPHSGRSLGVGRSTPFRILTYCAIPKLVHTLGLLRQMTKSHRILLVAASMMEEDLSSWPERSTRVASILARPVIT